MSQLHAHSICGGSGATTISRIPSIVSYKPKDNLGFSNPKIQCLVTGNPESSFLTSLLHIGCGHHGEAKSVSESRWPIVEVFLMESGGHDEQAGQGQGLSYR